MGERISAKDTLLDPPLKADGEDKDITATNVAGNKRAVDVNLAGQSIDVTLAELNKFVPDDYDDTQWASTGATTDTWTFYDDATPTPNVIRTIELTFADSTKEQLIRARKI